MIYTFTTILVLNFGSSNSYFPNLKEPIISSQDSTINGIERIMPNIISSPAVEYGFDISHDGNTIYFVRHNGKWGRKDNPYSNIYVIKKSGKGWSKPELAWFSDSQYHEDDIYIAPDNSIFFSSNRPYKGRKGRAKDIWHIEYKDGKYKSPKPLPSIINTESLESSPILTKTGNFYFVSMRNDGIGQGDIYMSQKKSNGTYTKPKIVESISTVNGEWNVFVSPNDQWMIFESSGRDDAKSSYGDLYFARKNENGNWQKPKPIELINTTGSDLNARLSKDNKYLYFASSQRKSNTDIDIFRIPLSKILDKSLQLKN